MGTKLTIVGPEPSDDSRSSTPARFNVEALLLMAKYDDDFRTLLLNDRDRAFNESGIDFSNSEKLLLTSIPRAKLETGIRDYGLSGVTRDSLPSWKEAASVIMLIMTIVIGLSCASGPAEKDPIDKSWTVSNHEFFVKCKKDIGWCDNDTYRYHATGSTNKKSSNILLIKENAKRAAILNAQYLILEQFKGSRIEGAGGMVDYEMNSVALAMEVQGAVKGGSVIAEKWDDQQNCEIIYEVKYKGLKKKVGSAEFR